MSTAADPRDQRSVFGLRVRLAGEQIAHELRVLQGEQGFKLLKLRSICPHRVVIEPALEQHVELSHATPAAPAQTTGIGRRMGRAQRCSRSAIMRLISAIALAGFKSLGQASVQFIMVWQR